MRNKFYFTVIILHSRDVNKIWCPLRLKYVPFIFAQNTYLKLGVGKAWAGHNNANVDSIGRFIIKIWDSNENDGALEPTGSKWTKLQQISTIKYRISQ